MEGKLCDILEIDVDILRSSRSAVSFKYSDEYWYERGEFSRRQTQDRFMSEWMIVQVAVKFKL